MIRRRHERLAVAGAAVLLIAAAVSGRSAPRRREIIHVRAAGDAHRWRITWGPEFEDLKRMIGPEWREGDEFWEVLTVEPGPNRCGRGKVELIRGGETVRTLTTFTLCTKESIFGK